MTSLFSGICKATNVPKTSKDNSRLCILSPVPASLTFGFAVVALLPSRLTLTERAGLLIGPRPFSYLPPRGWIHGTGEGVS